MQAAVFSAFAAAPKRSSARVAAEGAAEAPPSAGTEVAPSVGAEVAPAARAEVPAAPADARDEVAASSSMHRATLSRAWHTRVPAPASASSRAAAAAADASSSRSAPGSPATTGATGRTGCVRPSERSASWTRAIIWRRRSVS